MRELVFITGATGTGKSTVLGNILAPLHHVVAVDPAGDRIAWRDRGFCCAVDLPALSAALAASWRRGFRVVIMPPAHKTAECLDGVSKLLFGYSEQKKLPRLALAVDEMAECYNNSHQQKNSLTGFRRVILQGRHINLSVYGVTQRPQDVATQFRANCDRRIILALYTANARKAILEDIGAENAAALPTSRYDYLEWKAGKITKGRTRG
jgi:hypothetical protein